MRMVTPAHPSRIPDHPVARQAFLAAGQKMSQDNAENGGCGIQDGGQAAVDMGLAPDNQTEGDQVVDKTHEQKGAPTSSVSAAAACLLRTQQAREQPLPVPPAPRPRSKASTPGRPFQ